MTTDTKDVYIQCLVNGVNDALSRFDGTTGRFMSGTGWAVTNQDIIYPLALLYKQVGNPYHEDEQMLEHAMRGGDALRDFQYPDRRVEFVKVDGSVKNQYSGIPTNWAIGFNIAVLPYNSQEGVL